MKLSKKIPFDLKFSKLQGLQWNREDLKELAKQLYENQGGERYSIENRIFVLFDHSNTSSVKFLKLNEVMMARRILAVLENPTFNFFKVEIDGEEVITCIILIKQGKYRYINETHQHEIGEGLREPEKAEYATEFLEKVASADNRIIVNKNTKQHGVDGWVMLPLEVIG